MNAEDMANARYRRKANGRTMWATPHYPRYRKPEVKK